MSLISHNPLIPVPKIDDFPTCTRNPVLSKLNAHITSIFPEIPYIVIRFLPQYPVFRKAPIGPQH